MTRLRFWVPATAAALVLLTHVVATRPVAGQAPAEKALAIGVGDATLQWGACPPIFPKGCEVAVLHGDPAKGRSDVFLRVPASYAIPPHSHTSPEHMALVSGRLQVTYKGQPEVTLTPGT